MTSAVTVALDPCFAAGPFVFHDLGQAVTHATRLGYDALELFPGDPAPMPTRRQRGGLRVSAVGSGAGWVKHGLSLTDPDAGVRAAAAQFIRDLVREAAAVDAPVIIGSMQGRSGRGVTRPQALEWLGRAVAELAQAHPGRLLLEPLNRYETDLVNTLADAVALFDAYGATEIKVLADLFHMGIEEADSAAAVRQAGRWVGHVHLADSNRRAAGMGQTRFEPIVAALRDIGYAGFLAAECFPDPDPVAAAEATMTAFRRLTA
jgi:sugar phosphate isomerase/epimerase